MENKALEKLHNGQIQFGDSKFNPIKVSISQFYGIEINDFAVTVAKTALWIAESQMMHETEEILHMNLDFLPLKSYTNITEANALMIDWNTIIDKNDLSYIMGNPPFSGFANQSRKQKEELMSLYIDEKGKALKTAGKLDYVAGWYWKASEYIQNTLIRVAFVSTDSITQGEQVNNVWKPLYERFKIIIDFAYTSFKWESEANQKAQVFCVIIGFSLNYRGDKYLYSSEKRIKADNITPRLTTGKNIFIESRTKTLCNVPQMHRGNQPTDGGFLIFKEEEMNEFIKKEPKSIKYFKKYSMGADFINGKYRYCLWLVNCTPEELKSMPLVLEQVKKVKEFRSQSTFEQTRNMAMTPTLFREQFNPKKFIAIPKVSSGERRYIPIGYLDDSVIPGDKLFMIENAELYLFGILTSNVHMAWLRSVGGKLGNGYCYSKALVYNDFPFVDLKPEHKNKIEKTAQAILDARAKYPNSSLADLYDELTMPVELRKAHQQNDIAVMEAYGFDWHNMTESDCVAELMKMYQELVEDNK